MDQLSSLIFSRYKEIHGDFTQANADAEVLQAEFNRYAELNYLPELRHRPKDAAIFEVGTYLGHTLKWAQQAGYTNLAGIELDPRSCAYSREYTGLNTIVQGDVIEHLASVQQQYDVIFMKAVLEHVGRDETPLLLERLHRALKPDGVLIIAVPNMDWLLAGHERYLDLTHRMGYTRESLGAVLRLFFQDVRVEPFYMETFTGAWGMYRKLIRGLTVKITRRLFGFIGEGMEQCWFEHRSIKGFGYRR